MIHIICDEKCKGVASNKRSNCVNRRTSRCLPDFAHDRLEKYRNKFHQSVACQEGEKHSADWNQEAQAAAEHLKKEWEEVSVLKEESWTNSKYIHDCLSLIHI